MQKTLRWFGTVALAMVTGTIPLWTLVADPIQQVPLRPKDSSGDSPKLGCRFGCIEIRSDTEGIDFSPFIRPLMVSIKRKWYSEMPPSVGRGAKGVASVDFRVLQDGTVPEQFLKVTLSSGNEELDRASLRAIRDAAPFDHLPAKFSQTFIVLRLNFNYNPPPPK